jgi:hypothetical protein
MLRLHKPIEPTLLALLITLPFGQAYADTKATVQIENVTCQQNPSDQPSEHRAGVDHDDRNGELTELEFFGECVADNGPPD